MQDQSFKQFYTILLLVLTIMWAAVCVWVTLEAIETKGVVNILAAAGANELLGALIVLNVNVNQHWFRKGKPD